MDAIAYIRWSTLNQEDGNSLERQHDLVVDAAEKHGWHLPKHEIHIERGKSAYHGRNRAAKGKLRAIEDRAARGELAGKVLIVEAMDRLSRQAPMESLNLLVDLCKRGLTIFEAGSNTTYTVEKINENWGNLLVPLARAGEAHDSSKLKAGRVRSAWRKTQIERLGRTKDGSADSRLCPAWMEVVGGEFTVVEDRADVLRTMFRMAREGSGYRKIADWANAERERMGWPTKVWDVRAVCIQLADRRALGEYQPMMRVDVDNRAPAGEPVKLYPEIVSPADWHRTRESIGSRKNTGGKERAKCVNLLSHLVRCTYRNEGSNIGCGSKMVLRTQKSGYGQLSCSSFARAAGCRCNSTYHYNRLLKGIFEHVLPIAAQLAIKPTNEAPAQLALMKAALEEKRARRKVMAARIIASDDADLIEAFEHFKLSIKADEQAIREMEDSGEKVESTLTPAEIAREVEQLIAQQDTAEGRQKTQTYLDQLISAINMDSVDRSATVVIRDGLANVKLDKKGNLIAAVDALGMIMPKTYQMPDGSRQTFDPRPADRKDFMGELANDNLLKSVQSGALRKPADPSEQRWKQKAQ